MAKQWTPLTSASLHPSWWLSSSPSEWLFQKCAQTALGWLAGLRTGKAQTKSRYVNLQACSAVQWTRWISENAMNTNLHAFNIDSRANKFLHQQHGFTVAACYGAADFHVFLLGLVWGVRRRNKRLAEGQSKGLRCCGWSAKTLWVCAIWAGTEESVMFDC